MELKNRVRSSKSKITLDSLAKTISEEGSFKKLLGSVKVSSPVLCDTDRMTPEDLQACLRRAKENPMQPFSFLTKIPDEEKIETNAFSKATNQSTEIDTQLAHLIKRVELNRTLLERTNQRIKDIDLLVKQSESILPKNQFYDEEVFMKMKSSGITEPSKVVSDVEHPEIEEFCRTMSDTKDILDYVKKISKGEMNLNDLPANLLAHMGSSANKINKD
ncbi:hypothetical protein KPH14_004173 [Odynerus spinipes]|uniref:Uncharacterized protein n=1 Tax=Odynerus spinipes TaxID=1348599 RepID=A0AAD9RYV1_9HYME|nr:hypothetical protein KPH14_004173 [Odynerus spinipes]